MTIQTEERPRSVPQFIGAQFAQQFLPKRTPEQWEASALGYAQRGYVLCSMGDNRFVNPTFIRELKNGVRMALCPDRRGNHRMTAGPSAYEAMLAAYNNAAGNAVFARGVQPTLDEVRAQIRDSDPLITVADALDAGLITARRDTAEEATETEAAVQTDAALD